MRTMSGEFTHGCIQITGSGFHQTGQYLQILIHHTGKQVMCNGIFNFQGTICPAERRSERWWQTRTGPDIGKVSGTEILGKDQFPWPVRKKESTRSEEHTSELQSLMRISYAV